MKRMGFSSGSKPANGAVDTLVGRNTEILGDVRFTGGLHLDGTIRGKVMASDGHEQAMLSVSETGVIEGNVRVTSVVLNGSVTGDVYATDKITLAAKARVNGNVYYNMLEMQSGAQVNGKLVHGSDPQQLMLAHQRGHDDDSATTVLEVADVRRIRPV